VTVAAILLVLFSLINLLSPFLPMEGVPAFVVYLGVALGVAGHAQLQLGYGCSSGGLCG
jgi:hypothetical protein